MSKWVYGGGGGCKGLTPVEFNNFISKIIKKNFFEVKVGWFKDTLPTLSSTQKFAVVHIDCDLYESAIDALSFLFKRAMISNGAMILFDDWNLNHSNLNYGERRAWIEIVATHKLVYSDEGSYGMFGHKFIIHSYAE